MDASFIGEESGPGALQYRGMFVLGCGDTSVGEGRRMNALSYRTLFRSRLSSASPLDCYRNAHSSSVAFEKTKQLWFECRKVMRCHDILPHMHVPV